MVPANLTQLLATSIHALHILHHNGVLDAYGHLSVRNPDNPETFLMSRNLAPALVSSAEDAVEYRVSDASPVDAGAPAGFIERYIHSELYKRFAGIGAVVHSHAPATIPFGVGGVPLRPVVHLAGFLGEKVPVFDISGLYAANDTQDLLVRNVALGAALAAEFSARPTETNQSVPDHNVVLMQSHGFTTCASSIETAVFQAIYTQINAQIQAASLATARAYSRDRDNVLTYLTPQQARDSWASNLGTVQRPWGLWLREVKVSPLYVNELDP